MTWKGYCQRPGCGRYLTTKDGVFCEQFKYIEEHMGIDPDTGPYAFSEYDPEELGIHIHLQFKIAELAKKQGKKVHQTTLSATKT